MKKENIVWIILLAIAGISYFFIDWSEIGIINWDAIDWENFFKF